MAAPVAGSLKSTARQPLDDLYWVDTEGNLDTGLVFDGLHRWTKDTQKEFVRRNGAWEEVGKGETYIPPAPILAYIHRGTSILNITSAGLLNTNLQLGDRVYFNKFFQVPSLILTDGVTYYTNNIPVAIGLITDNGNSISAKVLGGIPPTGESGRFISISGSQSVVTIEADTYFSSIGTSTSITVLNGATLYHKGAVYGGGGGDTSISVTNSSYYHTGTCNFFGGYGLKVNGNSHIEMREDYPVLFNFRPAIQLNGSSVCDFYGGSTREVITTSSFSVNFGVNDSAILNLKSGIYKNLSGNEIVNLTSNSILNISSLVNLDSDVSVVGTSQNTINLHYGYINRGTISNDSIKNNLPADKFVAFKTITQNQYGTHPAFYEQDTLNTYLLGGTVTPPSNETLTILDVQGDDGITVSNVQAS